MEVTLRTWTLVLGTLCLVPEVVIPEVAVLDSDLVIMETDDVAMEVKKDVVKHTIEYLRNQLVTCLSHSRVNHRTKVSGPHGLQRERGDGDTEERDRGGRGGERERERERERGGKDGERRQHKNLRLQRDRNRQRRSMCLEMRATEIEGVGVLCELHFLKKFPASLLILAQLAKADVRAIASMQCVHAQEVRGSALAPRAEEISCTTARLQAELDLLLSPSACLLCSNCLFHY